MAARPGTPVPTHTYRPGKGALAGTVLVLLAAAAVLRCDDARADTEAIRALVDRETAAINRKDLQGLSEIWSQDKGILLFDVPPPGRFQGWDQIGRLWKDFFERVSDLHIAVDAVQVQARGTLGFATYDWSMSGRLGGYDLKDRGQATAIYRKEDGKWRLVHAHYSPAPPGVSEPPAAATGAPSATPGAAETPGAPATGRHAAAAKGSPSPAASPAATGTPSQRGGGQAP